MLDGESFVVGLSGNFMMEFRDGWAVVIMDIDGKLNVLGLGVFIFVLIIF